MAGDKKVLGDLRRMTKRLEEATEKREALILDALGEGFDPQEIASAAGVTRGRIYQIRDNNDPEKIAQKAAKAAARAQGRAA